MWASRRCPFCSSTRNIALGSGSTTRPSTSMAPSFFAMPYTRSLTRWYWCPPAPTGEPGGTHSVVAEQVVQTLSRGRPGSCGHSTTTGRRERHRPLYPGVPSVTNPPPDGRGVTASTPASLQGPAANARVTGGREVLQLQGPAASARVTGGREFLQLQEAPRAR